MATLRESNFKFMVTMGNILKDFNSNPNVVIEELKINEHCDRISLEVTFKNSETARKDFFEYFNSIGYTVINIEGYTDENYYDLEEYPTGASVIPEVVTLIFNAEIKEVVYDMKYWYLKADDSLTIPFYEL